jgi:hypothetical protein
MLTNVAIKFTKGVVEMLRSLRVKRMTLLVIGLALLMVTPLSAQSSHHIRFISYASDQEIWIYTEGSGDSDIDIRTRYDGSDSDIWIDAQDEIAIRADNALSIKTSSNDQDLTIRTEGMGDAEVYLTSEDDVYIRANNSQNRGTVQIEAEAFITLNPDTNNDGHDFVEILGNLTVSGTKSAVVTTSKGRRLLMAVEAPTVDVMTRGSGRLQQGKAVIKLDSTLLEVINTSVPYTVYVTCTSECNGLYISNKAITEFVVQEVGGGTSNATFDWILIAKRKGYEDIYLKDDLERPSDITEAPETEPGDRDK